MEDEAEEESRREMRLGKSSQRAYNTAESFPGGSVVKNPPANAGAAGSIPASGRFPGEGSGNCSSILA